MDGTLLEANASMKSFKRKDDKDDAPPPSSRNEEVNVTVKSEATTRTNRGRTGGAAGAQRLGQGSVRGQGILIMTAGGDKGYDL